MKTAICYFSGTGNSRHAADRLVEAFPSANLKPIVSLLALEHSTLKITYSWRRLEDRYG